MNLKKIILISGAMGLLAASGSAFAICNALSGADYSVTASFGVGTGVDNFGCASSPPQNSGNGLTYSSLSAETSSYSNTGDIQTGAGTATANLTSGVLTVTLAGTDVLSSAALWDTFMFSGSSSDYFNVTETLTLNGSLSANAGGAACLWGVDGVCTFLGDGNPFPSIVTEQVLVEAGVPLEMGAELYGYTPNEESGNVDLSDPPTFSITVPDGVTYTSASGVFQNVYQQDNAVPEPATLMLSALGLGLLGFSLKRRSI